MGRLFTCEADVTGDLNDAVKRVSIALMQAGVRVIPRRLKLRLRRFVADGPFADGVFIADHETFGVILFGPQGITAAEVDEFLFLNTNAVPFFFAHRDGDLAPLLTEPVLPCYPELPDPIEIFWPAVDTMAPANGGIGRQ